MSYTLYAVSCYIIMRGLQVLLEQYKKEQWYKYLMTVVVLFMLYAAVASILVWYFGNVSFLGFDPSK